MAYLFMSALLALLGQSTLPAVQQRSFRVPAGPILLYGISTPAVNDAQQPRPLVLVLHPSRPSGKYYYGATVMKQIFSPALNDLNAIMVAPDCPGRDWTDPTAERSLVALVQSLLKEYSIDRHRILVTGYSMGGQGAWFMESRHSDLFTAAIVIAGSTSDEPLDHLATIPTYVIHSRDDQVVPFEPAERTVRELEMMGREIKFDALEGPGHYDMGSYIGAIKRAEQWVTEHWANQTGSR